MPIAQWSTAMPSILQGATFNVTHFEIRITHVRVLYTAINTTEHGQVSQCLGFTKSFTSSIQRVGDVLHDGVSVTMNTERYNHMLETFFPTWDETSQLEYGESVFSAGWCHSPYGPALNEHPTCCFPRTTSLSVWWHSAALQFTGPYCSWLFLWGYLKAQGFTHTLPDNNSLKNLIRREIANVTQDTLSRVMASVPGRWQQCLDCHGWHLQDVVLKTWSILWIQDTDLLDRVQLYLLLCTIYVLSYFQNG